MRNDPIKVLVVDDDQGDFEMIRGMLSKSEHQRFSLDWVSNFDEAIDAFEAGQHQVYFLDYFLEDRTGLDLLKEARARGITAPIILLTGRDSRAVDTEAMAMGASDYLVKGHIDPTALERAIREAVGGSEAVQGQRNMERPEPAVVHPPEASIARDLTGAEARFRAVFESTRSGVALVDLDGILLEVNAAFAGMFSSTIAAMKGRSYLELLDEGDREAVSMELTALVKGEKGRFEAARRFRMAEGEVIWANLATTLIRDAGGAPDHIVVVLEKD